MTTDSDASTAPAAAIAMQVISVLSVHAGPLAARLAYALEKAHVFVHPHTDISFTQLAEDNSIAPTTRAWLAELENARSVVGGFWAHYTNSVGNQELQQLAQQVVTNALCIASGQPATALADPPMPAQEEWDGTVDDWALDPPAATPLFHASPWLSGDGGGSIRSGKFKLPPDKLVRGRRLMRALQHQVRECYEATAFINDGAAYNPDRNAWTPLPESPGPGRSLHTMVSTDDSIYISATRTVNPPLEPAQTATE